MFSQLQLQKQSHKIIPRQIAVLNIFHLDTLSLEQRIKDEINENPLLDQIPDMETEAKDSRDTVQDYQSSEENIYDDIPDYKAEYRNYLATTQVPEREYEERVDFREDLKRQFRIAENDDSTCDKASFIIDSLDEKGFLDLGLEKIATQISFRNKKWVTAAELEDILQKVQRLEPVGSGSKNIREYLLIQLKLMDTRRPDVKKAICLLEQHYNDLKAFNRERIANALGLDPDEMPIVLNLLSSLKKSPVEDMSFSAVMGNSIIPDFIIEFDGEELAVSLVNERSCSLFIRNEWQDLKSVSDESSRIYLEGKLASARWFISAIKERETNMLKIMRAVITYQHDYFISGNTMLLKPMVLKNIAEKVRLDISTVSRIISNKYAQAPGGIIPLKNLFSEGLSDQEGNLVSNRVLREMIVELISQENKTRPYTDKELADKLFEKGYKVARRTVVKYREQSNIQSAKIRAFQSCNSVKVL